MADGGQPPGALQEENSGAHCTGGISARYFCTAGRGMEIFLLKEVQSRLGATQVEYVSGKVFFTTSAELRMLKKLKSAERLFLLLDKYPPLSISKNKGSIIHDIQKLVNENSRIWLDIVTIWKSLHGQEVKQENVSQEYPVFQKRKSEEEGSTNNKRQKKEKLLETISTESQVEDHQERCDMSKANTDSILLEGKVFLEKAWESIQEKCVESGSSISFRVSCRCSGALAKVFPAQVVGRIIGIALMKHFGWKADLRNPGIEIFVHLNDIYSVIGIPVFRLPLASRAYIKTAGLRSTIAWAMASFAEIHAGDFVLDPTCGLGTVLVEAATEWPGAYSNIRAARLVGKIDLLRASATELPLPPGSINVVFADIPFGKKFKITNNMKFLPDVLQEIERVVCVGGTVVLLLSRELYKCINDGISSGPETENHNSVESLSDCTEHAVVSLEMNTQEKNGIPRIISPLAQSTRREDISNTKTILSSLLLVESFEVSLGKTDAFMCKYKKVTSFASIKS
ncbi:THUMP domain-containing protein 2 isoform X2 [Sphaerodactylus townsendi]|uniref:THUMP domain-containing protein 2 isoform X2 n=1 Tax=Sphaerodactylus townsendi TaxID=933632 RepID=UPI00202702A3|nr:THUMP domain-containing protein 2 isoform X2 [Sphaerodactylus townsendi]